MAKISAKQADEIVAIAGIDVAKNVFSVHGIDAAGKTVLRKSVRRERLLELFANRPSCLIGMEACGSTHDWARKLSQLGHTVRIMGGRVR